MATAKIQTGLRISEDLYAKALAIAQLERRSLNNLAEFALAKYVEEYEQANGAITIKSAD